MKMKTNNKLFNYSRIAIVVSILCVSASFVNLFAQTGKTKKTLHKIVKKTGKVLPVNPLFEDLNTKVRRIAQEEGINIRLFESLISQESGGRMTAVSYKGAKCLTQLMPATAQRYGLIVNSAVDERLNIDKCLRAGARYLRLQLDTFKDFRLALAAYNAGEGAVLKFGTRIPPYKETIQYVERIGYRFTGQFGHGTAFAWNLPVAVNYSQQVYGGRIDFRRIREANLALVKTMPFPPTTQSDNPTDANGSAVNARPVVETVKETPVVAEPAPARVPAASLFFWSKPDPAKSGPR